MALQKLPEPDLDLPRSWWASYWAQRITGKILCRIPGYELLLARTVQFFRIARRAALVEGALRKNRSRAVGDVVEASGFASGYGYESAAAELDIARMYKGQIASGQYPAAETPGVMAEAISILTDVITATSPRRVVNFGVSYAYVDSVLAGRFPDVQFTGIDRSAEVCDLNRADFALPNISFLASDINEWIDAQADLSDCVFFHVRTAILLPQTFLGRLYDKLAARKTLAICGVEPVGVSRQINSFPAQSVDLWPSVSFRDELYIHNYIGLLASRGYRARYLKYVKTAHVEKDVRMVSFVVQPMISCNSSVDPELVTG